MEPKNQGMPNKTSMKGQKKKTLADYLKMDKKDESLTIVVLVVLVCFGLGYFVFIPLSNSYSNQRIQTADLTRQRDVLQKKSAVLRGLEKDIQSRADFLAKTEDAMPAASQIPEFLVAISKYASDNSLYITNFAPKTEDKNKVIPQSGPDAYNTTEVDFDVTGSYLNMKQFIKSLEENIRPINIIAISITGGGEISSTNPTEVLRFSIRANIYYKQKNF